MHCNVHECLQKKLWFETFYFKVKWPKFLLLSFYLHEYNLLTFLKKNRQLNKMRLYSSTDLKIISENICSHNEWHIEPILQHFSTLQCDEMKHLITEWIKQTQVFVIYWTIWKSSLDFLLEWILAKIRFLLYKRHSHVTRQRRNNNRICCFYTFFHIL